MAFEVIPKILKVLLNLTCNQCKERKAGVIWQNLVTMRTNLAAVFWTLCSLFKRISGTPKEGYHNNLFFPSLMHKLIFPQIL